MTNLLSFLFYITLRYTSLIQRHSLQTAYHVVYLELGQPLLLRYLISIFKQRNQPYKKQNDS